MWNPTIANLTLMALGSSAPEILLSVIETVSTLGSAPGELGPSTIVGSAAFNLMVISAVSIISVGKTPKKIEGVGVFIVTACSSLFAYVWLWACLSFFSEDEIEIWEAIVTLLFFFILVVLAFIADKIKAFLDKRKMKKDGIDPNKPADIQELFDPEQFLRIMRAEQKGEGLTDEDQKKKKELK